MRIARHIKTAQYAAVKIVSKNAINTSINKLADTAEHALLSIEREIVIMKLIDHPNIMRLYDVWETSSELYLILEYVEGGELFDYLCNKGRLSTYEALGYFQQIISAIDYCHCFNIAHRDLKPENLLMDKDKNIKVADFGMAAWQANSNSGLLQTACGSPHYAAPEVVMGKEYNGRSSDIWSCGVILFALLAGRLPFDDEDLATLLEKVKAGKYDMPSGIDPMAKDLISKMLHRDAKERITIPEILKHPFYLSQEPKLIHNNMPDLDVIARPIRSKGDIDQDIFANLRTLWHGTPDDEIIECLRNDEPNWQKGVYHLLVEYRLKHLEDYDEEEELITQEREKKGNKLDDPFSGLKRTTSQATDLGRPLPTLPPRAEPPTPNRAKRIDCDENFLKTSDMETAPYIPPLPPLDTSLHPLLPPLLTLSPKPELPELIIPATNDEKMYEFFHRIVERLNAMEHHTGITTLVSSAQDVLPYGRTAASPPNLGDSEVQRPDETQDPLYTPYSTKQDVSLAARTAGSNGQTWREMGLGRGQFGELGKENQYLSVNAHGIIKKSSLRSNDTESRRAPLHVQIIEPSPSKLQRKKSFDTPLFSPAFSDSSFSLPATPRRRWLGGVFRFKPTNYELLSIHDTIISRDECRRLLAGIGVQVTLTYADESGVLKCKFDEVRDASGTHVVIRAVRFRVETEEPTLPQALAGYRVSLHFIQEKGASSSFQTIYHRLRRMWELDVPRTPGREQSPLYSPVLTEVR